MALSIQTRPSDFKAVHQPISYVLSSTLWPTNSVDTTRTVSTFSNDNGYTKLTLSGDIKTGVQELEYVTLTVDGVEGIYQIYNVFSDSIITIDLIYDGGTVFGNCIYYYPNYYASIKIYAGLRAAHTLNASKPTALLTTIKAVPDSSNLITININEVLKSNIGILDGWYNDYIAQYPNDLSQFTEFYIEYAESYSYSLDGYTLGTFTDTYTSDSANYAIAINSKFPFQISQDRILTYYQQPQNFLTMFEEPRLFVGSFFEIFFLRDTPNTWTQLRRKMYSGGVLLGTTYDTIENYEEGVYRKEIAQATTEDRIDIALIQNFGVQNGTLTYTTTNSSTVTVPCALEAGVAPSGTYDYALSIAGAGGGSSVRVRILYLGPDGAQTVYDNTISTSTSVSGTGVALPTPTYYVSSITILVTVVNGTSAGRAGTGTVDLAAHTGRMSEEMTINVDEECSNQSIYLAWRNYRGGMDQWLFTAQKDYGIDIESVRSSEISEYIGTTGNDRIRFDTERLASETIVVRSQNVTLQEIQALKYIKTSPLVQEVVTAESVYRTVLIDADSFAIYSDADKLYSIEFTLTYTDRIPSQSL